MNSLKNNNFNLTNWVIPQPLKALSCLFESVNTKLYIVGGFVRDTLLNLKPFDIDICSPLKLDKVKELLRNTQFRIKTKNKDMGTAVIYTDTVSFEYTCFRTDMYSLDGKHTPNKVDFVKNIKLDALRRDFYINALYYDLQSEVVVDPTKRGLKDLENRVLTVIPHSENTFEEDAVRILRLIKFSVLLNFEIAPSTYNQAKEKSYLLTNVSSQRLKKELSFISLLSDEIKIKVNNLLKEITGEISL